MTDTLTTQSATPATIPASTVIATDDAGAGGHVQVVKLAISTNGSATPLTADNTDGLLVNLGLNNDVTVTGSVTANAGTNLNTSALALESGGNLAAAVTALQIIDNFISGNKGLVTEDNSASILTSLQTIDNFISGARGLVTEDNSAAIKTAVEIIDDFISGSRGLVTEDNSAAALTSLQLLDDTVATIASAITAKGLAMAGTDGTNARILKTDTSGELQIDVLSSALPSGASTAAKQPALGTAGTPSADVITVQGVTSMTPFSVQAQPFSAMLEGGLTELVGINEQVDQNDYSGSVGVSLGATYSGEILSVAFYATEDGTGAVQDSAGILYVFDADPSISSGDTSMTAAERVTVLGKIAIGAADWDTDANGGLAYVTTAPIPFHAVSTLYFVWKHLDATSLNDAAGDDEQLRFNFWYRRES